MRRYKYLLFSIISFMLFNINIVLADTMDACTNVGVLKVIYFIKLLLNIAFIAVPIVLCIKSCWLWAFYGRHHKE